MIFLKSLAHEDNFCTLKRYQNSFCGSYKFWSRWTKKFKFPKFGNYQRNMQNSLVDILGLRNRRIVNNWTFEGALELRIVRRIQKYYFCCRWKFLVLPGPDMPKHPLWPHEVVLYLTSDMSPCAISDIDISWRSKP